MKPIALILITIILFIYFQIELASLNPCSGFSDRQSECNSIRK